MYNLPLFPSNHMSNDTLIAAEQKAIVLFNTIEDRGLIMPGKTEKQLNKDIYLLAWELFGIKKYWHKRIVRAGCNTLHPYKENPPDMVLQDDDILFLDFGPVFDAWEADFGRTFVIGSDPLKLKLKHDVGRAWQEGRDWYMAQTSVTGAALFSYCVQLAAKYGWQFGGTIAGHLVGKFPHEKIEPKYYDNYIHPYCKSDMMAPGKDGQQKHWILEIHFVDRERQIGGFFEQLLY